jgi:hypothetical protein
MFMEGFTSIITSDDGSTACVNLLFTEWTLDSEWKYALGCFGSFCLAVFAQYLLTLRPKLNRSKALPTDSPVRRLASALLFGLQVGIC